MIQVIFCSRHLYNEKNEIDVSLELPTDTETVKRYMETAGIKDKNDLLISDYTIHELYAGSCGEYQNWVGADLNELNYLAERLEKMFNEVFKKCCFLFLKIAKTKKSGIGDLFSIPDSFLFTILIIVI